MEARKIAVACFGGGALCTAVALFRSIHSQKRILCALDGTLGGAIAYFWLAAGATTLGEKIILVIFGGLLGAALGVLNYELVSKRWLHLAA